MHAAVLADLKFACAGSCTAVSSLFLVIEASKRVTVEVKSRFQTPSLRLRRQCIDVACRQCTCMYYIDDHYYVRR